VAAVRIDSLGLRAGPDHRHRSVISDMATGVVVLLGAALSLAAAHNE